MDTRGVAHVGRDCILARLTCISDQIRWLGKRGVEPMLNLKDAPLPDTLIRTEIDDIATKEARLGQERVSCSQIIV